MALQVWLPFDKDLNNHGLSNIFLDNTGTAIDDNGKIGKCMKITSSKSLTYITDFNTKGLTLCGWFKFNQSEIDAIVSAQSYTSTYKTAIGNLIGNNNLGGIGIVWETNDIYTSGSFTTINIKATLRTSTTGTKQTSSFSIEFDKWIYIILTWNPNTHILSLYKNGILHNSISNIASFTDGVNNPLYINYNVAWAGNHRRLAIPIYMNDIRVYDHCLSDKEVHEISKGLVLHYKLDNISSNIIYDCSGYENNGIITGTLNINNDTPRYNYSLYMNNTGTSNHIESNKIGISDNIFTVSFWIKADKSTKQVFVADPKIVIGMLNSLLYVVPTSSKPFTTTNFIDNEWNHICVIRNETTYKAYINGIEETQSGSSTYYSHNAAKLWLLNRSTNTTYAANATISDFRIYASELYPEDILELYNNPANIDNQGDMFSFEFDEEEVNKQQILQSGITKINNFIEKNDKIKVLDDGSVFLQILHHNNPASNLFTVSNCWLNNDENLYSAIILLKNIFNNLTEYEFLVCEKLNSSSTEEQIRWKQTSNPAISTTASGYTLISGSSSYLSPGLVADTGHGCFDMNSSSWWCCCGAYIGYQGGIPGFKGVVKSGYLDLYIRITNDILKGNIDNFLKFFKKSILSTQIIEK